MLIHYTKGEINMKHSKPVGVGYAVSALLIGSPDGGDVL